MIQFALPWALALLPFPLLIWRFVPPHRQKVEGLRFPFFRQIAKTIGAQPKAGAVVLSRSRLQMAAAIAAWVLIVLSLAQPQRVGSPIERTKAARDLILAIDISGSMDTRDFATPDGTPLQRLAAVKDVVTDFLSQREGDRVALIVFGSKAYVQSPLTEDFETVTMLLQQTEVGMAGPHTALGDAIGLAIRTFEASDIEQRLLILLSDGSDTASAMTPVNAAGIAARAGVEIHAIAVGDPEAGGEARVDLATLGEIASRTSGAFFFADDVSGLATVYDRIDTLAPRETETLSYRPRQSLAHWAMGLALLIGLIAVFLLQAGAQRRAQGGSGGMA
jgi:Ca-activated chloride channel family protein